MLKNHQINLRDPYVLPYDGRYYLYGTRGETAFADQAYGFDVYVSDDLEQWEGPIEVFHRPEGFWSCQNYWAPEVYTVQERFVMFATFTHENGGLGTAALISDSPTGPFKLWSDGYLTPTDWRCLDGTLYFDKSGKPWMVFCHEWRQIHDGTICAMPLSDDLRQACGEPVTLFSAKQAKPFVKRYFQNNYVTDGPFLFRTDDGILHMLWSTFAKTGYVEAVAHSDNQDIDGTWMIDRSLLYDHDGGHGMIFKDFRGQYHLSLHHPNKLGKEHPLFIDLDYQNGWFSIKK